MQPPVYGSTHKAQCNGVAEQRWSHTFDNIETIVLLLHFASKWLQYLKRAGKLLSGMSSLQRIPLIYSHKSRLISDRQLIEQLSQIL